MLWCESAGAQKKRVAGATRFGFKNKLVITSQV